MVPTKFQNGFQSEVKIPIIALTTTKVDTGYLRTTVHVSCVTVTNPIRRMSEHRLFARRAYWLTNECPEATIHYAFTLNTHLLIPSVAYSEIRIPPGQRW